MQFLRVTSFKFPACFEQFQSVIVAMPHKKPRSPAAVLEFNLRRLAAGELALTTKPSVVAELFGLTVKCVKYWRKKIQNPNWHSRSNGGHRY